jgi:hypothetical protein
MYNLDFRIFNLDLRIFNSFFAFLSLMACVRKPKGRPGKIFEATSTS